MPRPRTHYEPTATDGFLEAKADYKAAKRSGRFQRRRRGIAPGGAGADWHYRSESDYLWMSEAARDMDRNDIIIGSMVDQAVTDTISDGLKPDPDTGDRGLNKELKARWEEESLDPDYCDPSGELTFYEQEYQVLREMLVPGGVFGVPIADDFGTVELRELHRCRSPNRRTKRNIVHGKELAPATRKKINYWFTKEPIDPLRSQSSINLSDLTPVPARVSDPDDPHWDGEANVFDVYKARRPSQTCGVTALAPIFDFAGMHDDLQFAQLLKAQLSAFFLLLKNRDKSFFEQNPEEPALGRPNADDPFVEDLRPGASIRSAAGETVSGFSPNIPNAEFFPHIRLILQLLGVNLGLPLVLALMDASETNFSGWRGAVEQARKGFRRNQRVLKVRWHRPYWRFKLLFWADQDPALATWREKLGPRYLQHKWNCPAWPYIEPTKDATADVIRDAHMLTSPRRRCQERGFEWNEIVRETIEDRSLAISRAARRAQQLNEKLGLEGGEVIRWRDLAPLAMPERMSISVNANQGPDGQGAGDGGQGSGSGNSGNGPEE